MNSTNNLFEQGILEAWVINTTNGDGYSGDGRQQAEGHSVQND